MKLNLTDKQRKSLMSGKSVQLKHGQIGSGVDMNLHPMIQKKLAKAHMAGKGMRLSLSGGEIDMNGGKLSLNKALKKVGIKKAVNQNLTQKNVAKYALRGYNDINKQLEKQGMPSIHQAVLNEGLNYVPFVPSSVKDVASHYATKYADRALAKESQKVGAGVAKTFNRQLKKLGIKRDVQKLAKQVTKKNVRKALDYSNNVLTNNGYDNIEDMALDKMTKNRKVKGVAKDLMNDALQGGKLVNPYIPSSFLVKQKGGRIPMSGGGTKVYDDYRNILRPDQSGFKADAMLDPFINNDVFRSKKPVSGGGFRIAGEGISRGAGLVRGAGLMRGRKRKL